MQHSLSPLLMAIVCDHLGMDVNAKQLRMELVAVSYTHLTLPTIGEV